MNNLFEIAKRLDAKLPDLRRQYSIWVIIAISAFAFSTGDLWKPYNAQQGGHNFYWDVFGYYSYLPAYFCNGGDMHIQGEMANYNPPGPTGDLVPKYTYGTAVMYAPFFFMGYKIAINTGGALDGFSPAFVQMVHWSTLFYVLIALWFLRSLLLRYFREGVVALTLTAVFFGSMVFFYTLSQAEMTHGYLFALFSVFLWQCDRWHRNPSWALTVCIGLVIGLIALIRPTEIFVFSFFVLWNVRTKQDVIEKVKLLFKHWPHLLLILLVAAAWWIPQLLFYKKHAGSYFYFSYMRERFFWTDPQILNVLFSYRKGLITYTPLFALGLIGILFVRKNFPIAPLAFFLIFSVITYVLSCWWDWNYGGCFGARSFSQQMAIFALPLAFLIDRISSGDNKPILRSVMSASLAIALCSCIFLNMGFSYQYNTTKRIHTWGMQKNNYLLVLRTYQYGEIEDKLWWLSLRDPDFLKYSDGSDRSH